MLYIVGTPIGNLKEITYRAVEVLGSVDLIAAEDTRRTAILLGAYGIKKPMISYRKFNERAESDKLINLLLSGKDIALVSDAGMPLISDPGHVLTKLLREREIDYTVVGGPCACIEALILSGLDCSKFVMLGFLPEKKSEREKFLSPYAELPCTLVFYSSVHNVEKDIAYLYEALGSRKISVVREISKVYEQVVTFVLGETKDFTKKGEFVLVVEGAKKRDYSDIGVMEHFNRYVEAGLDKKEAIKRVAFDRGVAKSEIYSIVVKGAYDAIQKG